MSLKTSNKGGEDFPIAPEGQYVGRCFRVIDLGTQDVEYKGVSKQQKKVLIAWELLTPEEVRMEDERPYSLSRTYTNTLYEGGNLHKDLVSWRGKSFTAEELEEFDLGNVLGKYVMVQVGHEKAKTSEKIYANVTSMMSYQGKEKPAAINEDQAFDIDEPDMKIFDALPKYYQEIIQKSFEWKQREETASLNSKKKPKTDDVVIQDINDQEEINLDDIPF
jgi:hypothetical protein